jgi:archaellum biogenesis protein FlaJ (TadC family)
VGGVYYYLPNYSINKRGKNIDLFLPYAINFISSMAVAGISPAEIFETLSSISVYGQVQNEAKKIAKEITVMGVDNLTALKHALEVSPSKKFKVFLQGVIGTIQSGSDLHVYLSASSQKYMSDDLVDRKKDLDLLEIIGEVLVLSVIAFPIFLVIILTVMGFFGGSGTISINILLVFSFLILPLIYLLFYLLINSTSIERLTKIELEKISIKQQYQNNKTALFILFISAMIIVVLYGVVQLLGYMEYMELNLYFYWDFIFLSIVILLGPIGIYKYLELKKKKEMQQRLPDLLTELGDSLATGMNIFDAIKIAEKANYGRLSPEIKKMKIQFSWNISVKNALFDFAMRMKSAIAQRVFILINKGLSMGGNSPKIFKAAAGEVDQVNQIENQRKTIMSIYALVILICFFVFLGIIIIINKTIFSSFLAIQTNQVTKIGSVTFNRIDPMELKYALFSFVYVQSIGAGVIAGYMMDGKVSSGVRYSCLLVIVTFLVFKLLF